MLANSPSGANYKLCKALIQLARSIIDIIILHTRTEHWHLHDTYIPAPDKSNFYMSALYRGSVISVNKSLSRPSVFHFVSPVLISWRSFDGVCVFEIKMCCGLTEKKLNLNVWKVQFLSLILTAAHLTQSREELGGAYELEKARRAYQAWQKQDRQQTLNWDSQRAIIRIFLCRIPCRTLSVRGCSKNTQICRLQRIHLAADPSDCFLTFSLKLDASVHPFYFPRSDDAHFSFASFFAECNAHDFITFNAHTATAFNLFALSIIYTQCKIALQIAPCRYRSHSSIYPSGALLSSSF